MNLESSTNRNSQLSLGYKYMLLLNTHVQLKVHSRISRLDLFEVGAIIIGDWGLFNLKFLRGEVSEYMYKLCEKTKRLTEVGFEPTPRRTGA